MIKVDPIGPVPPYRQIAEAIRKRVKSGVYPKDSRIPTESEIFETWEVARTMARRAIAARHLRALTWRGEAEPVIG